MDSQASAPPPTAPPAYPNETGSSVPPQPYPQSGAPYPTSGPAPYPTSGPAPYPTNAPSGYPPQNTQDLPQKGYPPQGYPPPGYPGAPPPGYQPYGPAATTTQGYPVQHYVPQTTQHTTVITQQPGGVVVHAVAPPPDNLALSLISMFCCLFIGIFALLKSLKSRELYRSGDFAGAQQMGMSARRLATIAIVFAVCFYVAIVIIRIAVNVALA